MSTCLAKANQYTSLHVQAKSEWESRCCDSRPSLSICFPLPHPVCRASAVCLQWLSFHSCVVMLCCCLVETTRCNEADKSSVSTFVFTSIANFSHVVHYCLVDRYPAACNNCRLDNSDFTHFSDLPMQTIIASKLAMSSSSDPTTCTSTRK